MNRRRFLRLGTSATLGLLASACEDKPGEPPVRPSFLLFLADDLGYSDLACFGSRRARTPNLDALLQDGARLGRFYASPNCSPTRAEILTGRIAARVGMYNYVPQNSPMHLRGSEITVASLLRESGYETAHLGKWHLSSSFDPLRFPLPSDHGFNHWFATAQNAEPSLHAPTNFVRNGQPVGTSQGYACQIVADEAIAWLRKGRRQDVPFFLNVWFHEPHPKRAAPAHLVKGYGEGSEAVYFACIENMDRAVGRVLAELQALGLSENTLTLFSSDNGSSRPGSNGALRGRKSTVWEGGTRVPTIVRWPTQIAGGTLIEEPCGAIDLLATFCELAKVEIPTDRATDGVSLAPLLLRQERKLDKPHFLFFYRTNPACALHHANWVLVGYLDSRPPSGHAFQKSHMQYVETAKLQRFELYDLQTDPTQQVDVARHHPGRLATMKEQMLATHTEVIREGANWF